MLCRSCQTEIDDKALLCFRCGEPTTAPEHQPPMVSPRGRRLAPMMLGLVFLGVAGFFLTEAADGVAISPMVWVMLGAAGVLLAYRLRVR